MELRLLAHFSGDEGLLKAFREGMDIHRETAAAVFSIHPELVSAEMRRQAKVINFGIIYGMSPFGLAKQLGVSNRLAQDFIRRYFARHPQVKAYLDNTLEEARELGWVTTLHGPAPPFSPDRQQQPPGPPGGRAQCGEYPAPGVRRRYY